MRVRIVRTGLIGSSPGIVLTRAEVGVLLEDLNSSRVRVAAGLGAGRVTTDGKPVDATVVASPPATIAGVIMWTLERHPEAVVTDVGSMKSPIIRAVTTTNDHPE